MALSLTKIALS